MKLFRKNSIACVVLVITVICSILISSHIKLSNEADRVLDVFYEGERNDGLSIYSDLKDLVNASKSIVALSQKVMDPTSVELVALNKAINDYQTAQTPSEYYLVYSRIVENIDDVAAMFNIYCNNQTQTELFQDAAAVFASKVNTISYDPYNRYVREYQKMLDAFPAGLLAKITGVKEVSAFE